jgi:hypothetical protein
MRRASTYCFDHMLTPCKIATKHGIMLTSRCEHGGTVGHTTNNHPGNPAVSSTAETLQCMPGGVPVTVFWLIPAAAHSATCDSWGGCGCHGRSTCLLQFVTRRDNHACCSWQACLQATQVLTQWPAALATAQTHKSESLVRRGLNNRSYAVQRPKYKHCRMEQAHQPQHVMHNMTITFYVRLQS